MATQTKSARTVAPDTIFRRKGQGSDFPVLQCAAIDGQAIEFRIAQGRAGQCASSLDGSGLIVCAILFAPGVACVGVARESSGRSRASRSR